MSQSLSVVLSLPVGGSDIEPYTIVSATAGKLVTSNATAKSMGVSTEVGCVANAPAGDLVVTGYALVKCAAALVAGDLIMSNASGQAVLATSTNRVIGMLVEDAAIGQIAQCVVLPSLA